jgi:DNA (cytosine-5)-methyltransferase 1
MARLQSFPHQWQFVGSRAQQIRQVGNAVPPLLAEVIGREIARQLLGGRPHGREPKLMLAHGQRPPAPERVRPVHRQYLTLIGAHQPHPGHGLGPGARRRARELQPVAG